MATVLASEDGLKPGLVLPRLNGATYELLGASPGRRFIAQPSLVDRQGEW